MSYQCDVCKRLGRRKRRYRATKDGIARDVFSFHIDPELVARLDETVATAEKSRSQCLETILREHFAPAPRGAK